MYTLYREPSRFILNQLIDLICEFACKLLLSTSNIAIYCYYYSVRSWFPFYLPKKKDRWVDLTVCSPCAGLYVTVIVVMNKTARCDGSISQLRSQSTLYKAVASMLPLRYGHWNGQWQVFCHHFVTFLISSSGVPGGFCLIKGWVEVGFSRRSLFLSARICVTDFVYNNSWQPQQLYHDVTVPACPSAIVRLAVAPSQLSAFTYTLSHI